MVAFSSWVDGGNNAGGTGHSFSFNNVSGNIVLVNFHGDNIGGFNDITGVTYNGVAGASVTTITTNGSGNRYNYTYKFVNAPTGNFTVAISASNAHLIEAQAVSYSGVSDVDTFVPNFDTLGNSSLTTSITPTVSGCWVVVFEGGYNAGSAPSASTGLSATRGVDGVNGSYGTFDTNGTVTGGSPYSVTTTRNSTPTSYIQQIVISLAPSSTAPTIEVSYQDFMEEKQSIVSY